ncbi:serine/threonine-protein kinase [Streptomyces sp. NPDC047315]|uniref:serine/threonine-protein kinase n=1 Tax=Streptomyces sp. NPDC047315 TaxID=3155142 RepID=UPI0033DE4397
MSGGDNANAGRRVIDGRFELEARLGGGGMGMVWRARDLLLDRAVALKEVRPPDPALAEFDPEAARSLRARVLREARALARVDHPNVVTIHHVVDGGEDTYPWLVMELVTGGSLADRLARGPMEPAEVARLGREVLAALGAAHAAGIQHRDVKPANVLLRPDGRPVLTDFGIAAIRESTVLTATGSIIGTPDFMAPERITGEDGGPESDLWSLAMMLYVAVEGRHPLRRATALATLAAVLNEQLPPPRQAGPLTGVLQAVLVKDPTARPGPDALDRMLAEAASGSAAPRKAEPGNAAPSTVGTPSAAGAAAVTGAQSADATSYQLAPPGTAEGFGPSTAYQGAPTPIPIPTPAPGPGPTGPLSGPAPQSGSPSRLGRRLMIGSSLLSTAVIASLVWFLVPDDEDKKKSPASIGTGNTALPSPGAKASGTATGKETDKSTDKSTDKGKGAEKGEVKDLLTPEGIRLAIKELSSVADPKRIGSFTVYPEYVMVQAMVKGSDTKYDSYMYRLDGGVMQLPNKGVLFTGNKPFDLGAFNWDAVPTLMARAKRDLNVQDPTSRYLSVREPNTVFDRSLGLAVYLSNDYRQSGHLEATPQGKVNRLSPAKS